MVNEWAVGRKTADVSFYLRCSNWSVILVVQEIGLNVNN